MTIIVKKTLLFVFTGISLFSSAQGLRIDEKSYSALPKWEPEEQQGYSSYLPSSISYRKHTPIPGYQGEVASCTGWAVAYAQLTTQQNIMMNISNPIHRTARAMDPHFIYALIKNGSDIWCQEGSFIWDAMEVITDYGCKPQLQSPQIQCNEKTNFVDYTFAIASPYKISQWYALKMDADPVSSVKEALNAKHVVAVGMSLTNSFMTGSAVSLGLWSPKTGEQNIGGHAMCVVGYDDNKFGGSFEIMNSYSTEYGDGGYVWVKYSDFKKYMDQAYIIDIKGYKSTDCLFGDCYNDYGIYRTKAGDMYEGFMTKGYPDIVGTYYYDNGNFYVGPIKSGRKHGNGLFFSKTQARYYLVTYSNDVLVESTAIQGYSSSEDSKKALNYYEQLKKFVPGELVSDEEVTLEVLKDETPVSPEPMKFENEK
jgi:hypothetical protein